MKIRIQGNSVRLRLSKTDVEQLTDEGVVTETTYFGHAVFSYSLMQNSLNDQLTASFDNGKITVHIPSVYIEDWSINSIVGFDGHMPINTTESLYILVEKDFKCMDQTTEDQSDHYENPKKTC